MTATTGQSIRVEDALPLGWEYGREEGDGDELWWASPRGRGKESVFAAALPELIREAWRQHVGKLLCGVLQQMGGGHGD